MKNVLSQTNASSWSKVCKRQCIVYMQKSMPFYTRDLTVWILVIWAGALEPIPCGFSRLETLYHSDSRSLAFNMFLIFGICMNDFLITDVLGYQWLLSTDHSFNSFCCTLCGPFESGSFCLAILRNVASFLCMCWMLNLMDDFFFFKYGN